jgi:hypothetical protein
MTYTDNDLAELASFIGGTYYANREIIALPVDFVHTVKASGQQIRIIGQIWWFFGDGRGAEPVVVGVRGKSKNKLAMDHEADAIHSVRMFRDAGVAAVRKWRAAK